MATFNETRYVTAKGRYESKHCYTVKISLVKMGVSGACSSFLVHIENAKGDTESHRIVKGWSNVENRIGEFVEACEKF